MMVWWIVVPLEVPQRSARLVHDTLQGVQDRSPVIGHLGDPPKGIIKRGWETPRFFNGGFWPRISSMNIYRWWIFSCLTIGMLGKTSVNGPCSMAIWNFLEGKANHIPSKMPTEMGGRFVPSPIRRLIVGFSRCLHLLRWKTISLLREKKHLKNGCFAVFHHDPKWMETQRPDMIMENLA